MVREVREPSIPTAATEAVPVELATAVFVLDADPDAEAELLEEATD